MKINVIIDGNYLLYKDVFILKNIRRVNQDLQDLLIADFKKISKSYPFDNIYFVADHKSHTWRKDLYPDYKGNRTKDDKIDWDFVYSVYDNFKEKLKPKKNVKFLECPGLEGDDLIAHTIRESNEKGYSNVIISSDADTQQLVYFSMDKKIINLQWNYKFNDERIYLPNNYQLFLRQFDSSISDIFNSNEDHLIVEYIEKLVDNTIIKTVDCESVTFCKLLSGDKGDNIKSCVLAKEGKLNADGRGIGKDGAQTLYKTFKEMYPEKIDFNSDEFINNLADVVLYAKKIKDETAKPIVEKNLKFNRTLVVLEPTYMPENVYEKMKTYYHNVDNHLIEYGEADDTFFEKKKAAVEIIPDNFCMTTPEDDNFNIDDFWTI
jgi:5'-3' exonuclease